MNALRLKIDHNKKLLLIGISLIVMSLVALVAFGFYLANRSRLLGLPASTNAIIYVDVSGRTVLDQTLQIDGPAAVPVSEGVHKLIFFNASRAQSPLEASVKKGEFLYVSNYSASPSFNQNGSSGAIYLTAFPPDTTIEIPDCTPPGSKRPVVCQGKHILGAMLYPGTYIIKYSNPYLGEY